MNQNIFSTSDIWLSSVLVSCGLELVGVNKIDDKKLEFCFQKNSRLDELADNYWTKKLNLEPQLLFANFRFIKSRMYSI